MKFIFAIAALQFSTLAYAAPKADRSPASQMEIPEAAQPSTPLLAPTAETSCRLPTEQGQGSMIGSWEKLPITIVADRDLYLSEKGAGINALRSAIKTWNEWAARKGKVAFVLTLEEKKGLDFPSTGACTHSEITNSVPEAVGIWKVTREGRSANRPKNCLSQRKLVANGVQAQTDWSLNGSKIENASILLNFDDFHGPAQSPVDLESLLVHELGHVLGLLHSCNGSGHDSFDATTSIACRDAPKEFTDALMFPYLHRGKIRRDIRQNDLDRANCLY